MVSTYLHPPKQLHELYCMHYIVPQVRYNPEGKTNAMYRGNILQRPHRDKHPNLFVVSLDG